jgi:hypothetical protein
MTTKDSHLPKSDGGPSDKDGYAESNYYYEDDDGFGYDDSWDHVYDDNEHENIIYKSRRRSSKKSKRKGFFEDE